MKDERRAYRVLIVDDEDIFRTYLDQILRREGYDTVTFGEPLKALDYLTHNANEIDLILTDIVMADMDGIELAKRASRIKGETPLILLSGYSERLVDGAAVTNVKAVLDKPLLRNDLVQAIESVLPSDGNRRGAKQL